MYIHEIRNLYNTDFTRLCSAQRWSSHVTTSTSGYTGNCPSQHRPMGLLLLRYFPVPFQAYISQTLRILQDNSARFKKDIADPLHNEINTIYIQLKHLCLIVSKCNKLSQLLIRLKSPLWQRLRFTDTNQLEPLRQKNHPNWLCPHLHHQHHQTFAFSINSWHPQSSESKYKWN